MGRTGGKRAFRVYPPWADAPDRQAHVTRTWQSECFLPVPETGGLDLDAVRADRLYIPPMTRRDGLRQRRRPA
ncbi:MepB family protein [Streptomyces sp. NPDC057654]|uniref:MepB family protein n=1 Tax=Streptomyces sp. NPDC057654 TaxID=3346196 RepID=UPI00368599A9